VIYNAHTSDDGVADEELAGVVGGLLSEDARDEDGQFVFGAAFDAQPKAAGPLTLHFHRALLKQQYTMCVLDSVFQVERKIL
jgi:hypothetical protein